MVNKTDKITPDNPKETNNNNLCPFCEDDQIEGDSFDVEGNYVFQEMRCLTCEESWIDMYKYIRAIKL